MDRKELKSLVGNDLVYQFLHFGESIPSSETEEPVVEVGESAEVSVQEVELVEIVDEELEKSSQQSGSQVHPLGDNLSQRNLVTKLDSTILEATTIDEGDTNASDIEGSFSLQSSDLSAKTPDELLETEGGSEGSSPEVLISD